MYALHALKRITPPVAGWYNLDSNRVVTLPALEAWSCRQVRVCASTPDGIKAFCERNHIPGPLLYQPAQDVDVLCAEMVNRPLPNPPPNPESASHALNPFEWNHLRARCSILRVIDGDTLDAAVSFDPNVLIHQTKCVQTPTGSSSDRLWTVRLTLRLYGVDAAEKNTPEGKECIGLLVSHLEHIKSEPLTAVLCGNEKYGRTLAVLQRADGSFVNSFLVNAAKMCGRPLAKPYLGGAK